MKLDKLIPKYARIPLLTALCFNMFTYFGTKVLVSPDRYHDLSAMFSDPFPLIPAFVFVYILAFVQWGLGFIIIARDSRERCYRVLSAEMISKAICLCIFLIYPTTLTRVPLPKGGFAAFALSVVYWIDTPATNLFPSLHCAESWFCFRGAIGIKQFGKWGRWYVAGQLVFTLLVFVTVLLVKQHVWPDILAGFAVAELGMLISRLTHADRLLARTEKLRKGSSHE